MDIILAIDKVLQLRFVRWALLVLTVALLAISACTALRLLAKARALESAKAEAADSKAFLSIQNAAVLEWQEKGREAQVRVRAASVESNALAAEFERRVANLKQQPIREDCCGAIEDAKHIILGGGK